jgi:hypothetical protein
MAKDGKKKKVHTRATPKYTTLSDEDSSSDSEDNSMSLFANLSMDQKAKLNELIEAINEKDELLDSQEHFLVKENKKFVKLKNAYAKEVEKCENLSKELSICHESISSLRSENANLVSKVKDLNVCNDTISCLRDENAKLTSKIEELNACKPSTSTVDHVSICTRCRYINVEAIDDDLAMIKKQNDHIAKLDAKIAEHKLENENFKFARSMLYNGRRPGIKDDIDFQQGSNVKLNAPKIFLILLRAKHPWFRIRRVTFYILLTILNIRLGEFMLENLTLVPIMHFYIKMRLLALGNQLMLNCLKRKLLLHQMSTTFHLRLLNIHMCLLTNQAKYLPNMLGANTRAPKLVFGYPRCLFLTSKHPRLLGYLRTRPKFVL